MDIAANTAVVMRWVDAWSRYDLEALDELFASSYAVNGWSLGIDGVKQSVTNLRTVFAEPVLRVEDMVAERDRVVLRWTLRGIHRGTFLDIPQTGKAIALTGTNIYRLADGKIAENWENVDLFGLLRQLGAIVSLAPDDDEKPSPQ